MDSSCAYCDAKPLYRDRESGAYLCPVHAWLEVSGPRREMPRPPLTIRPADETDHPAIVKLATHFWGGTEIERFGEKHQVDQLPAYVACDGDEIVGAASYARDDDVIRLIMLNILPQWQGRGAARGLIAAVIQEAQAQEIARLSLAASNDDLPALGLYQRFGFRITGVMVGRLASQKDTIEIGFDGIPIRDEIHLELEL